MEDQMERRNSTYSLSSRGGSELESRYMMESGFYVTSFVATIFIAALITLGLLFITLLVTLTVMLRSCQNQTSGVVQLQKTTDLYAYCRLFALHAELNRLEPNEFPTICRGYATQYITEGQYLRDLKLTVLMAKRYFSSLAPKDSLDIVLMDIDDIFQSNIPHNTSLLEFRFDLYDSSNWVEEVKHSIGILILELYTKLRASGWSLVYITRKPETQRNETKESLISAGYGSWSSLIMRSDEEMKMESWEYFSRRRTELCNQGFRIKGVISSKMEALTGSCLGIRNFKLPDPIYKLDVKSL
ncbi:Acid phosphatase (Class B) [Macleaya cordata]|uniref:Acid phosphatase (Class B) n=1 Tax=Macleaya cordata TaxID=56857 RepID=A0A200R4U1_MACCD|nr:Acid phosphatase (Class B) [Macleaya cordata]